MLNVLVRHSSEYDMNTSSFHLHCFCSKLKLTCGHMNSCIARRLHSTNMEVFVFEGYLISHSCHGPDFTDWFCCGPEFHVSFRQRLQAVYPFSYQIIGTRRKQTGITVFSALDLQVLFQEHPAVHRAPWPAVGQRTGQLISNHLRQMMTLKTNICKINWGIQSGG